MVAKSFIVLNWYWFSLLYYIGFSISNLLVVIKSLYINPRYIIQVLQSWTWRHLVSWLGLYWHFILKYLGLSLSLSQFQLPINVTLWEASCDCSVRSLLRTQSWLASWIPSCRVPHLAIVHIHVWDFSTSIPFSLSLYTCISKIRFWKVEVLTITHNI